MARRILSAESALLPQAQPSLVGGNPRSGVYTEAPTGGRGGLFAWLQERWSHLLSLGAGDVLFDWDDRGALMQEIAFVNQARERLDEAAVRLSPAMLRIVLTVKAHLSDPAAQRAFLAQHLEWDLRRVSELCIVADRYGLLDPARRDEGRRELADYGWSGGLKLAALPTPEARREVWERACAGKGAAPYRALLEELKRYRERRLIAPPASVNDVGSRLGAVSHSIEALSAAAHNLSSPQHYRDALARVGEAQRELRRLRRALLDRLDAHEVESYAQSA